MQLEHYQQPDTATRQLMFDAVLDGSISSLEAGRTAFRSYAYLLQKGIDDSVHVWPPFLCAQKSVLGKDCPNLRGNLQSPEMNLPKAFEALSQLAVILQLMSSTPRYKELVPRHPKVTDQNSFDAKAIFEIEAEARTIEDLRRAVQMRLTNNQELYAKTLQIVVIPVFSEFPVYDFFLFHRQASFLGQNASRCVVAAGYQCKMGKQYPDREHRAVRGIRRSIWIEGRGPVARRKASDQIHGWKLLSREEHQRFFGESLFAALPPAEEDDDLCKYCVGGSTNAVF